MHSGRARSTSSVRPVPSESAQIGSTFTRIFAEQREPVRLGLGQRAFMRQDVVAARLRQAERADHAAGVPAAVLHPVGVETSGAVDNENPVAHPRREHDAAPGVAVALGALVQRGRISRTELQSCRASSAACSSSSTTS